MGNFRPDSPLRSKNDVPLRSTGRRQVPMLMPVTASRIACVLLPVACLAAGDTHAQRRDRQAENAEPRELSDTVRRVERETRGEVLSAERIPFDGRNVHRVKVLDSSGRVRVYMDDPRPARRDPDPPPRTRDNDD